MAPNQIPLEPTSSADPIHSRVWVVPPQPSDASLNENSASAQTRFFRRFLHLTRTDPDLLADLSSAAQEGRALVVYVDGLEPDMETISALLRCAFEFEASVTLVPKLPKDLRCGKPQ